MVKICWYHVGVKKYSSRRRLWIDGKDPTFSTVNHPSRNRCPVLVWASICRARSSKERHNRHNSDNVVLLLSWEVTAGQFWQMHMRSRIRLSINNSDTIVVISCKVMWLFPVKYWKLLCVKYCAQPRNVIMYLSPSWESNSGSIGCTKNLGTGKVWDSHVGSGVGWKWRTSDAVTGSSGFSGSE